MPPVSRAQHIGLIVAAVSSSTLSILGSILILRFVKSDYAASRRRQTARRGRRRAARNNDSNNGPVSTFSPTYLRLMFCMSCFDVLYSVNLILQPVLVDQHGRYSHLAVVGNQATCSALGAFHQLGFGGISYYVMLSFYYLFTVRLGKSQDWVAKRAEPFMHIFALGFPVITSVTGLIVDCFSYLDLYVGCWVANYPKGCQYPTGPPCSIIPGIFFGAIPYSVAILCLIVNNILVYLYVRKIYRRAPTIQSSRFTLESQSEVSSTRGAAAIDEKQRQRIRQVGTQSTLYVMAALVTYLPIVIAELILTVFFDMYIGRQSDVYGTLLLFGTILHRFPFEPG